MDGSHRGLIGLGHDLQLISELEVASALQEPDVFFTAGELHRFKSAVIPAQTMAGSFAAKEALFKALPAGGTWFWSDIELTHDRHGAPQLRTHGPLASYLTCHGLRVSVAISHSGGFVSAVVLVTRSTSALKDFLGTIDRAVRRVFHRITAHVASASQ